jgi:hypothetical protein
MREAGQGGIDHLIRRLNKEGLLDGSSLQLDA